MLGDTFAPGVFHQGANRLARVLASRATSRAATNGNAHKLELNLADGLFLDRTFELELIGATKQFDILCDRLRTQKDVISITTE